jgi:hypothetical protein
VSSKQWIGDNCRVLSMAPYTEILSEKGQTLRVIYGFKFRFHKRLRNGEQRWTCTKSSCKSFVKFDVNGGSGDVTNAHNHSPDSAACIRRQTLSNSIKRKAVDSLCDKPIKMIRDELMAKQNDYRNLSASDIRRVQKNVSEARSGVRPPLPKNVAELHTLLNSYKRLKTNEEENFLLVNDPSKNIVIFSTPSNLQFLSSCSRWYADGTFKSVPKLFYQLLTIHGFRYNNYVPLVFCLLPGKSLPAYECALRHLVCEMIDLGLECEPTEIFLDYEKAIMSAVTKVWPEVHVRGCRFHLAQSWWRQIQKQSLTDSYKDVNNDVGNFLKLFFGLPFLAPDEVEDSFIDDLMAIAPDDERVGKFTDYVLQNYIAPDSDFPPYVWAEYSASIARTTNSCESFHSHFNSSFYAAHPNIFIFTDTLLRVQCETYAKIVDIRKQKRRSDSLKKEAAIARLMTRRDSHELSRFDFLKRVSYKFLPAPLK